MVEAANLVPACLERPVVINIGLEMFFKSLEDQGAEVMHVSWKPPTIENDYQIQSILDQLL